MRNEYILSNLRDTCFAISKYKTFSEESGRTIAGIIYLNTWRTLLTSWHLLNRCFPYDLKTAILKRLLKKLGLDPENFKNLRSISNIAFLSKLLKSLACEQYVDHLKKCNLAEMFQSTYREGHSVETALVRVDNDIMRAFDEKKSVILVLLVRLSTLLTMTDCWRYWTHVLV